ncbi:MAG: methyl-accepting chemotaxis protein [Deferrisomatales bacterium]|nr:methyl-accepting chemotaxis protein [Deferrisomatales bacterium]
MRSLRSKLLISFCLTEVVIIALLMLVVSVRFRTGLDQQAVAVATTLEQRTTSSLGGHLQVLRLLLHDEETTCVRGAQLVAENAWMATAMQEFDLKFLGRLAGTAAETTDLDLVLIYDAEGAVAAAYPPGIDDLGSGEWFRSWPLVDRTGGARAAMRGLARLSPEALSVHRLQARVARGQSGLAAVAGQVLLDDFGDTLGYCVTAKILDGHLEPLRLLAEISDSAAAVYVGERPVVWLGFAPAGTEAAGIAPRLQGDGTLLPDPGGHGRHSRVGRVLAANQEFFGIWEMLRDPTGERIGTICTALPQAQLDELRSSVLAQGHTSLREIQTAILLVGAAAIGLFLLVTLAIGHALVTRPLEGVVQGLHTLALGDADLTRTLPAGTRDEVGQLARNFNRFLERMRTSVLRSRDTAVDIRSSVETVQRSSRAVHGGAQSQTENLEAAHGAVLAIGEGAASIEARTRTLVDATEASSSATQQMGATAQEIAAKMDELFQLVDQVSASIHQMSSTSGQVFHGVETLAATAQQTSASVAEMERNIGQVRQRAERTGSVAEEAAREALGGKQAVDATVAGVEALSGMVEESTGVIRALARRSGEIGGVLTTISDVAEQTNLLALNASIIAAQAGRHGTGFGVVANEIKTLAASTKASAKEITGIVRGLQEVAQQAVKSTESGHAQVLAEVERAREAGGRLDRILASSEESRSQAAEIARATQEQAEASRQITLSVDQVGNLLEQITAAVQQQTAGYRVLAGVSDSMRDIASQVKLGTDEQAVGSSQIATAMEHVRTLLEEIDAATREQTCRSQAVLASVASALEVARSNAALSADFDAAVATLTRQAETLQQEVGAFKT